MTIKNLLETFRPVQFEIHYYNIVGEVNTIGRDYNYYSDSSIIPKWILNQPVDNCKYNAGKGCIEIYSEKGIYSPELDYISEELDSEENNNVTSSTKSENV